jgi:hypothetical protein
MGGDTFPGSTLGGAAFVLLVGRGTKGLGFWRCVTDIGRRAHHIPAAGVQGADGGGQYADGGGQYAASTTIPAGSSGLNFTTATGSVVVK